MIDLGSECTWVSFRSGQGHPLLRGKCRRYLRYGCVMRRVGSFVRRVASRGSSGSHRCDSTEHFRNSREVSQFRHRGRAARNDPSDAHRANSGRPRFPDLCDRKPRGRGTARFSHLRWDLGQEEIIFVSRERAGRKLLFYWLFSKVNLNLPLTYTCFIIVYAETFYFMNFSPSLSFLYIWISWNTETESYGSIILDDRISTGKEKLSNTRHLTQILSTFYSRILVSVVSLGNAQV